MPWYHLQVTLPPDLVANILSFGLTESLRRTVGWYRHQRLSESLTETITHMV